MRRGKKVSDAKDEQIEEERDDSSEAGPERKRDESKYKRSYLKSFAGSRLRVSSGCADDFCWSRDLRMWMLQVGLVTAGSTVLAFSGSSRS